MRPIRRIIVHCAATRPEQDIGAAEIDRWHRERKRPFRCIGYHHVIRRNGLVEAGRPEAEQGAGVVGHNDDSIHVCLVGGHGSSADDAPEDHYTREQLRTLSRLLRDLRERYPGATFHGHNEFAAKACPGFRVADHLDVLLPPAAPQPSPEPPTIPEWPAEPETRLAALWRGLRRLLGLPDA